MDEIWKLKNSCEQMRKLLIAMHNLLDGYEGIDGNRNYVAKCYATIGKVLKDTPTFYFENPAKMPEDMLRAFATKLFKTLDDIDTYGDVFKPTWCAITKAVCLLSELRWQYVRPKVVAKDSNPDNLMEVNGNCNNAVELEL